jgi:hypothetical protein
VEDLSLPDGVDPVQHEREQLVRQYRRLIRCMNSVFRAMEGIRCPALHKEHKALQFTLDYLNEAAGDTEYRLACDLRDRGPIRMDGRLYEHEDDEVDRVSVRPLEPAESEA